jgi:hypothetical protein
LSQHLLTLQIEPDVLTSGDLHYPQPNEGGITMTGRESTERYLPTLLDGRADDLLGLFASYPVIDDPIAGRVAGVRCANADCGCT